MGCCETRSSRSRPCLRFKKKKLSGLVVGIGAGTGGQAGERVAGSKRKRGNLGSAGSAELGRLFVLRCALDITTACTPWVGSAWAWSLWPAVGSRRGALVKGGHIHTHTRAFGSVEDGQRLTGWQKAAWTDRTGWTAVAHARGGSKGPEGGPTIRAGERAQQTSRPADRAKRVQHHAEPSASSQTGNSQNGGRSRVLRRSGAGIVYGCKVERHGVTFDHWPGAFSGTGTAVQAELGPHLCLPVGQGCPGCSALCLRFAQRMQRTPLPGREPQCATSKVHFSTLPGARWDGATTPSAAKGESTLDAWPLLKVYLVNTLVCT